MLDINQAFRASRFQARNQALAHLFALTMAIADEDFLLIIAAEVTAGANCVWLGTKTRE
jgi:hypothetical protein